jgi:hypothetical protein
MYKILLQILSNCDIGFFNFCQQQVRNFKILNQSKQDQNFTVNFQEHQMQNQELSKYIKIQQNQSIIPNSDFLGHEGWGDFP